MRLSSAERGSMEKRLHDVLSGQEDNYIVPFFWQHGEEAEKLKEYMKAVYQSGIRGVCVESRPHPDYVGEKWWEDMDVILEEAGRLSMKVWVLDDAHFPTGYCNGKITGRPEYGKIYLDHYSIDVPGPDPYASFLIKLGEGERLLGVVAAKRTGSGAGELGEAVDITKHVKGDIVSWPVPGGYWNIIIVKTALEGKGRKDYCNLLDAEAVRFFLDTVYEPHWNHYKELFGSVFAGFFSDEPEFGNTFGEYPDSGIGQPTMPLPWCEELEELTERMWGADRNIFLAALWSRIEKSWEKARYEYMNMITDLYGKNFCGQVGKWCSEHGVDYIGHVIEDNGNHARTGYGTGHFFKALWGQQMSGIDVVLQQIRPGYDDRDFYHIGGKNTYDGVFFHYGLAKMGSSLGHMDPKKKGRTMCELYGAYGWSEGLKLMKWLADHMLVRGVNWFVPHAFSPAAFPDADCPPHFYAQGMNPQFPWFSDLMHYINRMSHLLNGGIHVAKAAVLYSAELGWIGKCSGFEHMGKLLMRNQIDFDVLPMGILESAAVQESGTLLIGEEVYSVLIVPECEKIPEELAVWMRQALAKGFPIWMSGGMPQIVSSSWKQKDSFLYWRSGQSDKTHESDKTHKSDKVDKAEVLDLKKSLLWGSAEELLDWIGKADLKEIQLAGCQQWLRYYHYRHTGGEYFLFFNENPWETIEDRLILNHISLQECDISWYDAWDNCLNPVEADERGEIYLTLSPYQTAVLYVEEKGKSKLPSTSDFISAKGVREHKTWLLPAMIPKQPIGSRSKFEVMIGEWKVSLKSYEQKEFGPSMPVKELVNITSPEQIPDFSGTIKYEGEFMWNTKEDGHTAIIDCGKVFETLEAWVNGRKQAVRIAPPYEFTVKGLQNGKNHLVLYVTNTLVHKIRDTFSATMPIEASGLLGPVKIKS